MLLFEFEGALFQFDEREPQFDPLSQLPPKIAAFYPDCPLRFILPIQVPVILPTSAISVSATST